MQTEETSESLNAAGMVNMKLEISDMARSHVESAQAKLAARDGAGCLAELDAYDKLEPKRKSTDPKVYFSQTRAQCLMLAGKCDPGKVLLRKTMENLGVVAQQGPEAVDKGVEFMVTQYCQGKLAPRDELLQGFMALAMGANVTKKKPEECEAAYKQVTKNRAAVKPRDDEDHQIIQASTQLYAIAPGCFGRAGDCVRARAVFDAEFPPERLAGVSDPKIKAESMTAIFESAVAKCKK